MAGGNSIIFFRIWINFNAFICDGHTITYNHSNLWIVTSFHVNQGRQISRSSDMCRCIIRDGQNMSKKAQKNRTSSQYMLWVF